MQEQNFTGSLYEREKKCLSDFLKTLDRGELEEHMTPRIGALKNFPELLAYANNGNPGCTMSVEGICYMMEIVAEEVDLIFYEAISRIRE
jgi:hypothetical protein